jgi:exonuclease III
MDRRNAEAAAGWAALDLLGLQTGALPSDKGMRLDQFLLSPQLSECLIDGGVDRWVRGEVNASDHAPVWIEPDV